MQVIWSKEANDQLVQIISYGTEHFGNNASLKLYRRFWNTTQLLASQPYMGKSEPLLAENPKGYRSLYIPPHYKIIYCVDSSIGSICISNIWDTRRDPDRLAAVIK